jgi:hypothetical protein
MQMFAPLYHKDRSTSQCPRNSILTAAYLFYSFSRLQHHEPTGRQRESSMQQWPLVSWGWCGKPWWGLRPGCPASDCSPTKSQVPSLPLTPPHPSSQPPLTGSCDSTHCRCRMLMISSPPWEDGAWEIQNVLERKRVSLKPTTGDPLCLCFVQSGLTHLLPVDMF